MENMTVEARSKVSEILIVDDHPVMRSGLASLLDREEGLRVAGEAGTTREAMQEIKKLQPDLVLADLRLPDGSGLELIKDVLAQWPGMRFLVISMHDEKVFAERVLRAGGRGYVMKDEASELLLKAVRRVLSGGIHVSDAMKDIFVAAGTGIKPGPESASVDSPMKALTDRELQVFELVGGGLSTRAMAERLSVGVKTIETHCANVRKKLGLKDRGELNSYAVRWYAEQS